MQISKYGKNTCYCAIFGVKFSVRAIFTLFQTMLHPFGGVPGSFVTEKFQSNRYSLQGLQRVGVEERT